jgi:cytochrome P450
MLTIIREPFMDPNKRWWKHEREKNGSASPPFIAYSSLFGKYSLLILDLDIVKLLLTEPASRDPVRFPKYYFFIKEIIGEGLVTLDGSAWSRHRRIIQPSLHTNSLKEALNRSIPVRTETLISAWRKAQGCTIDVASHMSALTLDVIGDVAFSHDFGASRVLEDWAEKASQKTVDEEQHELEDISDPLLQAFAASLKITVLGIALSLLNLAWLDKYLNRKSGRTCHFLQEGGIALVSGLRKSKRN